MCKLKKKKNAIGERGVPVPVGGGGANTAGEVRRRSKSPLETPAARSPSPPQHAFGSSGGQQVTDPTTLQYKEQIYSFTTASISPSSTFIISALITNSQTSARHYNKTVQ